MTSSIPADDGSAAVPIKRPPPVEFSTREFREAITRKDADAVGAQIDALVAAGGPAWSNELERELMRSGLRTIDPVRCVDVSTWIAGNSKDIKTAQELLEKIIDRSVKWLDERKRNGELAPTRDEMLQLSPLGIYLRATNDKYKMLHGKDALTDHLIHEMMERTMDGTYVLDAVEIKTKKTDYTRVRPRHILPDGRLGTPWIWREVDTKKVVMTYEVMYQERNNRRRPGDRRAPRKKKKEENVTAETKKPKRKKDKDDSEEVPEKKPSKRRKKAIDDGPAIAAEEKEKKKKKPKKATTKDAPKKSSGAAATALLFASPSPGIARAESEGDDDDDCGSARNPAPSLKMKLA